jgi:F-type H+-transporting ATPase subunit epsilon
MAEFGLKIVTPDGLRYDGVAEKLVVRTTVGDVAILPGHINYVAPLGMGETTVTLRGNKRHGACIGGMVSVVDGKVTLVPTSFEWAEDIDAARAQRSEQRAKAALGSADTSDTDLKLATARLKRALLRRQVAEGKP